MSVKLINLTDLIIIRLLLGVWVKKYTRYLPKFLVQIIEIKYLYDIVLVSGDYEIFFFL